MMPFMIDKPSSTEGPPRNVESLRPRPGTLEARVKALAKDSKNVAWGSHARERMYQRGITDLMMFEVLRGGYLRGEIEAGNGPAEWKCKMVRQMKGRREVGVVTIIARDAKLFVKTVEWEDQ